MSSLFSFLNKLLPFATPGTPLIQDLLHLAAICAAFYFAPQIQEQLQQWRHHHHPQADSNNHPLPAEPHPNDDLLNDENPNQPEAPAPEHPLQDNDPNPLFADPQHENDPAQPFPPANDDNPGPAHLREATANRNVGAKKAKSLARRDQRRAYHEFLRSQGDAQRAQDAQGAEERDRTQAAERERRRAAETALEAKKALERERRREAERKEREEESERRDTLVRLVRQQLEERRMCNLFDVVGAVGGDVDEIWAERILAASGVLRSTAESVTMVTSTGWVVEVTRERMREVYAEVKREAGLRGKGEGKGKGRVGFEEVGVVLERVLRGGRWGVEGMGCG